MSDLTTTNTPAADATVSPEPRARRGQARGDTRARLLAAAEALFVEKGFHATRPQDISRAAGVGHGTFYLHFKDKQDCFLAFAEKAAETLEAFVEEGVSENAPPYESIRGTMERTYQFAEANPGLMAAALTDISVIDGGEGGAVLMQRWGEQWAERLAGWQAEGRLRPGVDTAFIGFAIPGMMRQAGLRAVRDDTEPGAAVDALMEFLSVGLGLTDD